VGVCRCVDPYTGETVRGSTRSGEGHKLNCEETVVETECQRQYREMDELLNSNPGLQDTEYPLCDENGLFEKRQCIHLVGVCRCVDPYTGETVRGSNRPGEGHKLNCEETVQEDQVDGPTTTTTPVIDVDESGDYSSYSLYGDDEDSYENP